MEIDLFQDIITSFSNISHMTLEVWDESGVVFSSHSDGIRGPSPESLRSFCIRIVEQDSFQRSQPHGEFDFLGVPVHSGSNTIGSLVAYMPCAPDASAPAIVNKDVEAFLSGLSELIQDRLNSQQESEKMAEELTRSFEDLYLYSSLATQVKTLRFSSSILSELISELLETMRSDLAFARLPDRQEYDTVFDNEILRENVDDPNGFINGLLEAIPADEATLAENYFILNDSRNFPFYQKLCPAPYRFLAVRIQHSDNFYGWLGLVAFNLEEIFRRGELRLLISVAEQIAVVLSNTDLYNDLEGFVINVVKSLVYAIEAKDQYTRGHSERVNHYSTRIADQLDLDDRLRNDLNWAAVLHDVGKIGIPESILNKPGRLTDEEYGVVKDHPRKGYDILLPIEQLRDSLPGILHHHERYDGKGYPNGLESEGIPLMARIIAVADTFDAISSSRAYRSASSMAKAYGIVCEAAGTQLDPGVVEAFKLVFEQEAGEEAA